MVKMLTVLESTTSNSQLSLLKNMSSFCKSYSHFFSKNVSVYVIFEDQSFNDMLTATLVSNNCTCSNFTCLNIEDKCGTYHIVSAPF